MVFKKGYVMSEEHKRKIGIANSLIRKGKPLSEINKKHIKEAMNRPEIKEHFRQLSKGKIRINIDRDKLYELYITNNKNLEECANYFNCSSDCITYRLNLYKINKRTREEQTKKMVETKKRLFKEGKIKVWSKGVTGPKHPSWKGGKSFEPYTPEFNKQFKEAIKIRDGFLCLKCGMREEDSKILFGRKLHIHHIDYIKENTFAENCCATCNRCNVEVNSNRASWTKFFQSMLSERYGYKYSEDGKVIIELNADLQEVN